MRESENERWRNNEGANVFACVCMCLYVCALDLNSNLSVLGRIVLETAAVLDAIITQAAQGPSHEMLPYIKVLSINTD